MLSQNLHTFLQEKTTQNAFSGVVRLMRGDGTELFANAYGYAVYFCCKADGDIQFYLGQGEDNGVSSKSVYFPQRDVLAVMLANQDFCTWPIVWEIYKLLGQ